MIDGPFEALAIGYGIVAIIYFLWVFSVLIRRTEAPFWKKALYSYEQGLLWPISLFNILKGKLNGKTLQRSNACRR